MSARKKIRAFSFFCVLLALASGAQAAETVASKTIQEWYAVAVGGLNLRDQPAMTGKKLALIPFGTRLEATGNEVMNYQKADYWTEVRYKDQTGWVRLPNGRSSILCASTNQRITWISAAATVQMLMARA